MPGPTIEQHHFRRVCGKYATGITIVTVLDTSGAPHGMTANSFTSVSLEPMLILVCVDQRAKLLPLLEKKRRFGVSVLKQGQEAISEYFAKGEQSAEAEERLSIRYDWKHGGIPLLEDTLLRLPCSVVASYITGDHTIFVGEVESAEMSEGEPLVFYRGEYRKITRHG